MNIFDRVKIFFGIKKIVKLTPIEFDELVDVKIMKLREYIKSFLLVRDDDDSYDEEFNSAFLSYEIKLKKSGLPQTSNRRIVLSPINVLEFFKSNEGKFWDTVWYVKWYHIIRIKIGLYWRMLVLLHEIRRVKRIFPHKDLSNQRSVNIINAVKINKKLNTNS